MRYMSASAPCVRRIGVGVVWANAGGRCVDMTEGVFLALEDDYDRHIETPSNLFLFMCAPSDEQGTRLPDRGQI